MRKLDLRTMVRVRTSPIEIVHHLVCHKATALLGRWFDLLLCMQPVLWFMYFFNYV